MNRQSKIKSIRGTLKTGNPTIGSWMQIPNASVAEIMGKAGYDWVAIDFEHGSFSLHQLPNLFRALELGGTLPLVRLAQGHITDIKQALDAGAGGVIIPMVENAEELRMLRNACCWPPAGTRGVGFCRANLFGKDFNEYQEEAASPLVIAMIENINALNQLENILKVNGLDSILIGPYDLSASLGITGQFTHSEYTKAVKYILNLCNRYKIAAGIHIVEPDSILLKGKIDEGYRFIAYGIDSVFLIKASQI